MRFGSPLQIATGLSVILFQICQSQAVWVPSAAPRRSRDHVSNLDADVTAGFGDEWTRFDQSALPAAVRAEIFNAYFRCFPWARCRKMPSGPTSAAAAVAGLRWLRHGSQSCTASTQVKQLYGPLRQSARVVSSGVVNLKP